MIKKQGLGWRGLLPVAWYPYRVDDHGRIRYQEGLLY